MNPYVKRVRPLDDYQLEMVFENGEHRIFDVKPYLRHGVFVRLQNRAIFQAVRVVAGSVEWPGELDLSYDTLYLESRPILAPTAVENEEETEEEILASERKWDELFARPESRRLLRTMAAEAREDYLAGYTTDVKITDDGRLAPG
jgi:hypothetical protein